MKILAALDSFKGSISSRDANLSLYNSLNKDNDVIMKSIGDGGEGTMEAIIDNLDGEVIGLRVMGPKGEYINSEYGICNDLAVIEMARCAGITLLKKEELNPLYTTTYGVGEMITDAIKRGCRRFIICIGGSATNDGGMGMLKALGYHFLDENHEEVSNNGLGLRDLKYIDDSERLRELDECSFEVASDVDNPLYGPKGASYVFARQKGADDKTIEMMDRWLRNYADISMYDGNANGCGAAGGLGFALKYYLNARMQSGIELVSRVTMIEDEIRNSDLVICGEGRIDEQTLNGKAPLGIARLAKKHNKRVIGVCGVLKHTDELDTYFDDYYEIMNYAINSEDAMNNADKYLGIIGEIINEKYCIK